MLRTGLRCSFCGKKESEIAKLVAGPRVRICDQCVAIASRMMGDDPPDSGGAVDAPSSRWGRLASLARRVLHRSDSRGLECVAAAR